MSPARLMTTSFENSKMRREFFQMNYEIMAGNISIDYFMYLGKYHSCRKAKIIDKYIEFNMVSIIERNIFF